VLVDTSDRQTAAVLAGRARRHDAVLERRLRALKVDLVDIDAASSYVEPLQKFFAERAGRIRRGIR